MKKFLLTLLLCLLFLPAGLAEEPGRLYPAMDDETGLWGYIDGNAEWAIPPQFDWADVFRGDYAMVELYPAEYEASRLLYYDCEGIIDRAGNWVLPPEYSLDAGYDGKFFGGRDTGIWLVWKNSDVVWGEDEEGEKTLLSDSLEGFFDIPSGCFSGLKWDGVWPWCSDSRLIPVIDQNGAGYADRSTGDVVIPCQFFAYDPSNFYEGVASVAYPDADGNAGDFFLIDETGAEIPLPEGIHSVYGWGAEGGRVRITDGKLYGYADLTGRILVEPQYAAIYEDTDEGTSWVEFPEGDEGFADRDGQVIRRGLEALKWWHVGLNSGYYARETGDNEITLYTLAGEEQFILRSENLVRLNMPMANGLCWFETDPSGEPQAYLYRRWGLVDLQGRVVSEAQWVLKDFEARDFSDGLQLAGIPMADIGVSWGFIDASGQWVIEPIWDRAESFEDGLAWVRQGKKVGYIDRTGREVFAWQKDEP